jgi:hypothetical protein
MIYGSSHLHIVLQTYSGASIMPFVQKHLMFTIQKWEVQLRLDAQKQLIVYHLKVILNHAVQTHITSLRYLI